jgi:chemotaxis protein MotB
MSGTRKRPEEPHEEHPDERWMASYMDMVTVLMCMFIVLFAMSTVDANKFAKLSNSLATGFGHEKTTKIDVAEGIVAPPKLAGKKQSLPTALEQAKTEVDDLTKIKQAINKALLRQGLQRAVKYEITDRGLIVRLVGAETFFRGNSVDLTPKATRVLSTVGKVIRPLHMQTSVEGHADPHGSSGPYPTDWELASGRAVQVLRYFVEQTHVSSTRIRSVGFGSARSLSKGHSAAAMELNRRVDVVILSNKSEDIRKLMPGVQKPAKQPDPEKIKQAPTEKTSDALG